MLSLTVAEMDFPVMPEVRRAVTATIERNDLAIAGPGGAVGFATPAYPPFFREPALAGLSVVPVGLAEDGAIDLERWSSGSAPNTTTRVCSAR